jgi:hypothetical protein
MDIREQYIADDYIDYDEEEVEEDYSIMDEKDIINDTKPYFYFKNRDDKIYALEFTKEKHFSDIVDLAEIRGWDFENPSKDATGQEITIFDNPNGTPILRYGNILLCDLDTNSYYVINKDEWRKWSNLCKKEYKKDIYAAGKDKTFKINENYLDPDCDL